MTTRPAAETWECNRYVIECPRGVPIGQFMDDGGDETDPMSDRKRAMLAAQAPAMARLLIAVLNRVNDPLATEISEVLDAAGVIKIERAAVAFGLMGMAVAIGQRDVPAVRKDAEPTECTCAKETIAAHQCPYQSDVNNDAEYQCNCCDFCQRNCLDDI